VLYGKASLRNISSGGYNSRFEAVSSKYSVRAVQNVRCLSVTGTSWLILCREIIIVIVRIMRNMQ
jgi:hypothetical protein